MFVPGFLLYFDEERHSRRKESISGYAMIILNTIINY
jgi:hypothetical protein